MHHIDLRKLLNDDDGDDQSNPVLNDRFEIKDLIKTTCTSKIYTGTFLPYINEVKTMQALI